MSSPRRSRKYRKGSKNKGRHRPSCGKKKWYESYVKSLEVFWRSWRFD